MTTRHSYLSFYLAHISDQSFEQLYDISFYVNKSRCRVAVECGAVRSVMNLLTCTRIHLTTHFGFNSKWFKTTSAYNLLNITTSLFYLDSTIFPMLLSLSLSIIVSLIWQALFSLCHKCEIKILLNYFGFYHLCKII